MSEITRYGFEWGPVTVTRMCHVKGRGYVLEVATKHERLEVYVSEKGRRIWVPKPDESIDELLREK